MLEKYLQWFKAHERILVITLVLFVGYKGVTHYLNNAAAQAETRAHVAEAALASQKSQDAQLAITVAQVQQQYQAMVVQLTNQNATLSKSITIRSAALQTQQGSDSQLPPSSLAQRVQELAAAPSGSVSAVGSTVVLEQPAAVAVVESLDSIPVLTSNLNDTKQIASNLTQELDKANALDTALGAQVNGLNIQLKDSDTACKTEITSVKAKARKSKLRWFLIGVVTGFVGRGAI